MTALTLDAARIIAETTLKEARARNLKPIMVVVLDARATIKAVLAEDGNPIGRFAIAQAKATGSLGLGVGTRTLRSMSEKMPSFVYAAGPLIGGVIPSPGGILIRDDKGEIVGAIGVSGDTGDNDEVCGIAGIEAAGFKADGGQD